MKVYTKKGDTGQTSLIGQKISKTSDQIEAIGSVDELNSHIGILLTHSLVDHIGTQKPILSQISSDLFLIGSVLASKKSSKFYAAGEKLDPTSLEEAIDTMTEWLPPLKNFILPGTDSLNAACHLTRSVCRRAERRTVSMFEEEMDRVQLKILAYLNRLSDYLFTLARYATYRRASEEIIWYPNN